MIIMIGAARELDRITRITPNIYFSPAQNAQHHASAEPPVRARVISVSLVRNHAWETGSTHSRVRMMPITVPRAGACSVRHPPDCGRRPLAGPVQPSLGHLGRPGERHRMAELHCQPAAPSYAGGASGRVSLHFGPNCSDRARPQQQRLIVEAPSWPGGYGRMPHADLGLRWGRLPGWPSRSRPARA